MLLVFEFLFIVLLGVVLYMLYSLEQRAKKDNLPKASAEEYWKGKERRQHVRFKKSLPVVYIVEKKYHLKRNSSTIDISAGGMKLLMAEKLEVGTLLDVMIDLPSSGKKPVEVEGEVAWTEEGNRGAAGLGKRLFYSGIKFSAIKEPSGKHLSDYLSTLAVEKGE